MPSIPQTPVHPSARRLENYEYAIRTITDRAKDLESHGRNITYLNIGDPLLYGFRPPEEIIEATVRALKNGTVGYAPGPGISEAREAVAENACNRGIPALAGDVIMTSGASEAAELALTSILDPGDEVLTPCPGYPLYQAIIARLGAKSVPYPLDPGNGWMPDIDAVESLLTPRCKILLLINPGNPTGMLYPEEVLVRFAEIARKHRLIVFSDEVYHRIVYDSVHIPMASAAGDDVPVITIDSLSKNYMAPGLRTGWMLLSNSHLVPEIRKSLFRLADARLCAPVPPQFAVRTAMSLKNDYLDGILSRLKTGRDLTCSMLNAMDGVSCTLPKGAFYVMARFDLDRLPFNSDETLVLAILEATGLLFVHGSGFGTDPSAGFVRIVYLPEANELREMYLKVADFVKTCQSSFLPT
jgi:aspartate/methionine/tyrosine aminotransferase